MNLCKISCAEDEKKKLREGRKHMCTNKGGSAALNLLIGALCHLFPSHDF